MTLIMFFATHNFDLLSAYFYKIAHTNKTTGYSHLRYYGRMSQAEMLLSLLQEKK